MAAFSTIYAIVSVAFTIITAKMQRDRAKKAAKNAEADAHPAASLEFTVEATTAALAIPYGRCKIGGVRTLHVVPPTSLAWILFFQSYNRTAWGNTILDAYQGLISGAVDYTVPTTARNARTFSNTTLVHDNSKVSSRDRYKYQNEVLIMQQAICRGGINQVLYAMVDQKPWEKVNGVHINVYCDGGVVDPLIAQQGYTNNYFTNTAYATCAFLLDRERAQFGGAPEVQFLIEGLMVRYIQPVTPSESWPDGYMYTTERSYSNNPALCLLDYLLDTNYGLAIDKYSINLESFFAAMILCEYVVVADAPKNGIFWSQNGAPRHIKRFECNLALSGENTIRDNITKILESMDMADLIWSGGQYKLQLKYPVEWSGASTYAYQQIVQYLHNDSLDLYRSIAYANVNNPPLIGDNLNTDYWDKTAVAAYITDDDIIRGKEIAYAYPNAQTRYNNVIIKFRNESKEFAEDTVSWPGYGSGVYAEYFYEEDNKVKLETEISIDAITDYWHAIAKAEQICRSSRSDNILKLSVSGSFNYLEPGDIMHLTSNLLNMPGRLFLIDSAKVQVDNTIDIEATVYDARFLAWNAADEVDIPPLGLISEPLEQATDIVAGANNTITWTKSIDTRVSTYTIKYTVTPVANVSAGTSWVSIGQTSKAYFAIPDTVPPGNYTFTVVAGSSGGQTAPSEGWPLLALEVTGDYMAPQGEPSYLDVIIYKLTATSAAPDTPEDGVYDFDLMALSTVPTGWSTTIPGGTGTVWQSIGLVEYFPGDATVSMTDQWQAPIAYDVSDTTAILSPSTVIVMQDNNGVNFNYDGATGVFQVFVDSVEKTQTSEVVYSVESYNNCIVTINNVTGPDKGKFLVVELDGSLGSAILRATIAGQDYDRELTVSVLNQGYIVDLSEPPAPLVDDVTVLTGFNHVQIELAMRPDYTEGNGHAKTVVYYGRVPAGDPVPNYGDPEDLGVLCEFVDTLSPLCVVDPYDTYGKSWHEYDYYLWVYYVTNDGMYSDISDPISFQFEKIRTSSLEQNAVTVPISAESFVSMDPLELPSTDFGDSSVLITVNASGLLVDTAGESASMEIRLDTSLIHTIPMLVGTQEIGDIPMASGSFVYIDNPGEGEHVYELTVTGLDSILHQSITAIGLKR